MNFLIIFISILFVFTQGRQDTLKYIGSIFRHGARGPIKKYANFDNEYNKYFEGELTATGQRQHYSLGQELRKRYIIGDKFKLGLKENYDHDQIYVRSTDFNRTIISAQSQLIGLYPPGTGPVLPEKVPLDLTVSPFKGAKIQKFGKQALPFQFQNIPIHTFQKPNDFLLMTKDSCPEFHPLLDAYKQSQQVQDKIKMVNEKYQDTLVKLTKIFGSQKQFDFNDAEGIFDVLLADKYNGQLPSYSEQITPDIWDDLYEMDSLWWPLHFTSPDSSLIISTKILQSWLDYSDIILGNVKTEQENLKKLKYTMYSAHDDGVFAMQYALNMTTFECLWDKFNNIPNENQCYNRPYYAASIILELYQPDTPPEPYQVPQGEENPYEHYIKILYNGEYIQVCGTKKTRCTLENFRTGVNKFIYVDLDASPRVLKLDKLCQFTEDQKLKMEQLLDLGVRNNENEQHQI